MSSLHIMMLQDCDAVTPDWTLQYFVCRGLYHCNYCQKDITGVVRIKCAVCQDFDLCLDCFSVGVEIDPHKNHHAYRVMDSLAFPLFHPDWGVSTHNSLLVHAADSLLPKNLTTDCVFLQTCPITRHKQLQQL